VSVFRSVSKCVLPSVHRASSVPAALMGGSSPVSAFDDIWGWWRADTYTSTSPTIALTDLSGNSRTMTQQAGTLTPGTSANGQARMVGNASAYLTSAAALESWPVTIFTFGQRTTNTTQGMFGHAGATGYNGLWYGYEASNSHRIYNTNSTNNANADTDGCWIARIGNGSRVSIVNGLVQADMTLASVVKTSPVTASIGTQYRGLNFSWQECLVWNRVLTLDEIDEVHAYLNDRYGAAIPMWSSYAASPTLCMHGQSNSAGRGDRGSSDANIPAEYLGSITGANVWHGLAASNGPVGSAFETLNNTASKTGFTGNHMFGDNVSQPGLFFGAESALCKEYLDANGGSVYLNKYAVGSTSLAYQAGGHWSPTDNTLTHAATARHFAGAVKNWWSALRVHQLAARKPDIKGIIWHQGEQDAANLTMSNAYEANLSAFIDQFRAELGYGDAPLFLCRLHDECPETYTNTVRTAQATVAASKGNCQMVDLDGYEPRSGDPVHLSFNGQIELGQDLAAML